MFFSYFRNIHLYMKENNIKYINKQPENSIYPKLPMRGILLAPSNSGKHIY